MNARISLTVLLVASGFAAAQPPARDRTNYELNAARYYAELAAATQKAEEAKQQKQQSQRLYEDIEVMRRILIRKLDGLYPRHQYGVPNYHGSTNWNLVPHVLDANSNTVLANWLGASYQPITSYRAEGDGAYSANTSYQLRQNPITQPKTEFIPLINDLNSLIYPPHPANQWLVEATTAAAMAVHAEGAYLKDYGVTYHVTAPPRESLDAASRLFKAQSAICASCHDANVFAGRVETPAKPASLWEQTRQEITGAKEGPAAKPTAANTAAKEQPICEPGTLAENILRVLSENGHNFSGMTETDKLTVIVTFRDQARTSSLTQTYYDPRLDVFATAPVTATSPRNTAANTNQSTPNTPPPVAPVAPVEKVDPNVAKKPSSARDYELLADLHLKQGRFDEAIATYQRAVEQKPDYETLAKVYAKLSEAHSKMKRTQDQQTVEAARQKLQQFARAAALPGKLIITVSKKNLNQVGTGKMSFEDFKKAASVEFLSFGTDAKTGK